MTPYPPSAGNREDHEPVELVRRAAHLLTGALDQYDPLLELTAGARFVLLGEASRGTHDFYRERIQITKRLILEQGFNAVAVEADWPDTERASHYFGASLSQQFDAVLHFDETRAVEPLERTVAWETGEVPETYPSGI
jgi:erythromycin esterase-like protein